MPELFIDAHCHFFSAKHVPLTQTLQRVQKKVLGSNAKKLKLGATITAASPLFPFAGVFADNLIDKVIPFIQFFDTDASYSIDHALTSMLAIEDMDIENRLKIFTPLIMDFEVCVPYKRLNEQVDDMKENIKRIKRRLDDDSCLILPFLGIDARRFDDIGNTTIADKLDQIILEMLGEDIKHYSQDTIETDAKNGDFIGIKLYPSLGFDLWPSNKVPDHQAKRQRNIDMINALATKTVPVTVHCQTDSYECGKLHISDKTLVNYAKPQNWVDLLDASDADNVRLNLAHFGGEAGVTNMLQWESEYDNEDRELIHFGPRKNASWTYNIIRIIKKYKNAYSDIGAFDFDDKIACASLLWLIHLDETGELGIDGDYKLIDKLMWGTDIPMTLFDNENYKEQFDKFYRRTNLLGLHDDHDFMYALPPRNSTVLKDHTELLEKLVNKNPARFLFGD